MNMFKIAIASVATLGLGVVGAAKAEPIRASQSLPAPAMVKKGKILRTVAPARPASHEVEAADVGIGLLAGGLAGFGLYQATKGNDSPG